MKLRFHQVLLLLLAVLVGSCLIASRVSAQDRAKPRDRERKPHAEQGEKRRQSPPSTARERQPRPQHEGQEARPRDRDDARDRHPRPRVEERRPPDRRYEGRRDYDRYHWNRYRSHRQWNRDRFPRWYFGLRLFDRRYYNGHPFGPHYRLWYRDRYRVQKLFYWPFYYPPELGCNWYWVPRDRILIRDNGVDYYEYSDYDYVYICFD